MGDQLIASVVTVASAIIGLAIIAVLVSNNANTSGVVTSAGTAFANDIKAAVSPVSGSSLGGFAGGSAGFM